MNDLISRKKALDGLEYEMKYGAEIDRCGLDTAYDIIENIPSAEQERTAKVDENWGFAICCACKARVLPLEKYCSNCGSKLEWK